MGKALLIKNVDFSEVALDKVEIYNRIPCESITLDKNTITGTEVGETVKVTATVTPASTTDEVVWTSDNLNVANVTSEGVVTIQGIGTATITATCGAQTATVTVSQENLLFTNIEPVSGYRANNIGSSGSSDSVIRIHTDTNATAFGKVNDGNENLHVYWANVDIIPIEAIPVPYGATKATIQASSTVYVGYVFIADMNDIVENFNSKGNYPRYTQNYTGFNSNVPKEVTFGQCLIFSLSQTNAEKVTGLLFE